MTSSKIHAVFGGRLSSDELLAEWQEFKGKMSLSIYRELRRHFPVETLRTIFSSTVTVTVERITVAGGAAEVVAAVRRILADREHAAALTAEATSDEALALPPGLIERFRIRRKLVPAGIDLAHLKAVLVVFLQPTAKRSFTFTNPVNEKRVERWARNLLGADRFDQDAFEAVIRWLGSDEVRLLQPIGRAHKGREVGRTLILSRDRVGPAGKQLLGAIAEFMRQFRT